jgi:type VI protein secretion system component VasF
MNLWQRLNAFDRRLRKALFTWKSLGVLCVVWLVLYLWFGYLTRLSNS